MFPARCSVPETDNPSVAPANGYESVSAGTNVFLYRPGVRRCLPPRGHDVGLRGALQRTCRGPTRSCGFPTGAPSASQLRSVRRPSDRKSPRVRFPGPINQCLLAAEASIARAFQPGDARFSGPNAIPTSPFEPETTRVSSGCPKVATSLIHVTPSRSEDINVGRQWPQTRLPAGMETRGLRGRQFRRRGGHVSVWLFCILE